MKTKIHLHERFLGYPVSEKSDILDSQFNQGLDDNTMQLPKMNETSFAASQRLLFTSSKVNSQKQAELTIADLTNKLVEELRFNSEALKINGFFANNSSNKANVNAQLNDEPSFNKPNGRK